MAEDSLHENFCFEPLRYLSQEEMIAIHQAALQILERTPEQFAARAAPAGMERLP